MPPQSEEYQYYLTIILVTSILVLLATFIIIFVIQYQKKHKKYIFQQKAFEETLLLSKFEIHEQTLQQVAYEMHDNIAQVASLIKIHLQTFKISAEDPNFQKLELTKDLIRQLIADVKSLAISLGSDRINQMGFGKALEIEVERINAIGLFECSIDQTGVNHYVEPEKATILFRMTQEILNNIIRHSQTEKIFIQLHFTDTRLTLSIEDRGIGFEYAEALEKRNSGLKNINERAKMIRAKVDFNTCIGRGTTVTIEMDNYN